MKCIARISDSRLYIGYRRCQHEALFGSFCQVHRPEAVAARARARSKSISAKFTVDPSAVVTAAIDFIEADLAHRESCERILANAVRRYCARRKARDW